MKSNPNGNSAVRYEPDIFGAEADKHSERDATERDHTACGASFAPEPFVDTDVVSSFLSISRADVLKLTRERKIRGYPYRGTVRHLYRYRLSEVAEDFAALCGAGTILKAAPVSQRRKSNG